MLLSWGRKIRYEGLKNRLNILNYRYFEYLDPSMSNTAEKIKRVSKNKPIDFVLFIKFTQSNIIVHLTDVTGRIVLNVSSGLLNLKGKERINKYAILQIIRILFYRYKNTPLTIALHFRGLNRNYIKLVTKHLKKVFLIKIVKCFNSVSHNGCKPKKIRRLKNKRS